VLYLKEVKSLANIKSAKKRIKIIAKKTLRNKMIKSGVKTAMRKFDESINGNNNNPEELKNLLIKAVKTIDKAETKGVVHKNWAARKKSKIYRKFNKAANGIE
jgi:small subunit ribosomal protein S20